MDKTPWNFIRGFSSINLTKTAKKTRGEMLCRLAVMTSLMLNSKLYNLITSWNLIKTPKKILHSSFSIKLTKYVIKTGVNFWSHDPFNNCIFLQLDLKFSRIWTFFQSRKADIYRCFPVNIAKFLRTTFFTEHL